MRKPTRKTAAIAFSFLGVAFIVGFFSLLLLRSYFALQTARQQTFTVLNLRAGVGSAAKYGVVDSVDPVKKTIVLDIPNPFTPGGQPITLTLHVPDDAVIAAQTLIANNGAYDTLSTQVPATLSDINPADRAVISLTTDPDGTSEAKVILFGNPL